MERLRVFVRTKETSAEYKEMSKEEQSACKDVGGFVGGALRGQRRLRTAVTERWAVTLDADNAKYDDWENFTCLFSCACALYSTHSHTKEHPRYRWVLPLDRAVSPEEYEAIARMMASYIGIETMDPTTFEPHRLFFWPSCPSDAEPIFHEQSGPTLNADEILAEYGDGDAWKDERLWPRSKEDSPEKRRDKPRQENPQNKAGVIGAFCRVYDVESAIAKFDLPYEPCDIASGQPRYTYTRGSTSAGAV